MMTFRVRLKKAREPNPPRLRFDLEKQRDPDVVCTFQATIGGKFAPLIGLSDEDMYMDTMITIYNTAVTDAALNVYPVPSHHATTHANEKCHPVVNICFHDMQTKIYFIQENDDKKSNSRFQA